MLGAIIGDIAGSRFEGFCHFNIKTKKFELLSAEHGCQPTDDSVMTLAIAKAMLECNGDYLQLEEEAVKQMQRFGRRYPNAGYGGYFYEWIFSKDPQPYYSFGNGAAMRVSPCGFAAKTLEEAIFLSRAVTKVTHNHPEGMKAAEAVSVAIFLARTGKSMEEIRKYIIEKYYNIRFTLNTIRRLYRFDVTCQPSTDPRAAIRPSAAVPRHISAAGLRFFRTPLRRAAPLLPQHSAFPARSSLKKR